jgi:GNAT acetyltransferase-like protein
MSTEPSYSLRSGVTNTIFEEPWWLDAVAPRSWQVAELRRDGRIVGRWPYVMAVRAGMTYLTQSSLTPRLGPWLQPSPTNAGVDARGREVLEGLLRNLPAFDCLRQNFPPTITDWLPFYWHGFEQTTRYTYQLPLADDIERLWEGVQSRTQSVIRKAERVVQVEESDDLGTFIELNRQVFARQGIGVPYTGEMLHAMDRECRARGARRLLFARDAAGRVHGGLYLINDVGVSYYLLGASTMDGRASGAMSALIWQAILDAKRRKQRVFDFEGSVRRNLELFFRGFGARQVPYSHITSMSRRYKVLWHAKLSLRALASGRRVKS